MEEKKDFTEGKLYVFSSKIYQLLVIHFCLLLSISPSLVSLLFLERSIQNSLLFALLLLPVGPALAATISAMLLLIEHKNSVPFKDFWESYQRNFKDSFKLWVLYTVGVLICLVDIHYLNRTSFNFGSWFFILLLGVLSVILIFALIISVKFVFSTTDILKLSMLYIFTQPAIALKIMSYLIILLASMAFISDGIIVLVVSYFMWCCLKVILPILSEIETKFVEGIDK